MSLLNNTIKSVFFSIISTVILLSGVPLFSQLSLDQSWGNEGTIEVTTDSILYGFREIQFDEEGSIYISGSYDAIPGGRVNHGVNNYPFIHKLTSEGELAEEYGLGGNLFNTDYIKVGNLSTTGGYVVRDGYTLFIYDHKVVILDPKLDSISTFGLQSLVLENTIVDFRIDEDTDELSLVTWGASYKFNDFSIADENYGEKGKVALSDLEVDGVAYGSYPGLARRAKFAASNGSTYMLAKNIQDPSTNAIIVTDSNGSSTAHSPKAYGIGNDTIVCGSFVDLNDSEVLVLGSEKSAEHGNLHYGTVLMKFGEQGFDSSFGIDGLIHLEVQPDIMNGPLGLIPLPQGYYLVLSRDYSLKGPALAVLNAEGELITELGDKGFSYLDFIPGSYVFSCQLAGDANGNVYLMTREDETTLKTDAQQYFLSKLDIEGLLEQLEEQERQKELASETAFALSPNPDLGRITLTYTGLDIHDLKISVFNELGQLVGAYDKPVFTQKESFSIDDVVLSPGIYVVKVNSTDGDLLFSEQAIVLDN